jgi:Spy/CpxP family protein refolding chaperone
MRTKNFLFIAAAAVALQFTPVSFAHEPDGQDRGRPGRHMRLLANLSPEERAKFRAARQAAMADPAVQAARERRRQNRKEFRDLVRARMLQADPTIQPILDKLPARGGRGS